MKRKLKRSVSLLLVLTLFVSIFTGCDVNKDDILPLDVELSGDGTQKSLVVSYSEDIFKEEIENDQIQIGTFNESEQTEVILDNATNDEIPEPELTQLTGFTVTVDSAKQLTITLADGKDSEYSNYTVGVDKKATTVGKHCSGSYRTAHSIEEQVSYNAEISGEYTVGDSDPVIIVNLENTVAVEDINADMLKLTGLFSDLEIASVTASGNTLTITTKGSIPNETSLTAGVDIAAEATNSGEALSASCSVEYRGLYVDQASYAFEKNILTFDVILSGDTWKLSAGDKISSDDIVLTLKKLSEDKQTATFSTPVTAENLDDALSKITGTTVTVTSDKLDSGIEQDLTISAAKAELGVVIDYIDETDTADRYKADAIIYAKNGTFGEISASDISFVGDFADAKTESVEKDDTVYTASFTFTAKDVNTDEMDFSGTATLSSGKMINSWGTKSGEATCEAVYVTGIDRGETLEAIKAFVAANKSTFKTISTVGSTIGGVASAVTGVVSILELCGVIESTNDKLDSIRDEIKNVQQEIQALDNKIDRLGNTLIQQNADIISKVKKNTYSIANGKWDDFLTGYVMPLSNTVSNYNRAYNAYMLDYISKAGTSDSVPVYIDSDGNVTLPSKTDNGYSIDGKELKSQGVYHLSVKLEVVNEKIRANNGRLYNGYWNDITEKYSFDTSKNKEQDSYNQLYSLIVGNKEQDEEDKKIFNTSRYNFAVYMVKERGMSENGLFSNFNAWFLGENSGKVHEAYEILKEGNYYYSDDKIAYVGNSRKVPWKSDEGLILDSNNSSDITISTEQYFLAVQLDAAYYALNKVGTENILNSYTNFCYMIGGKAGGSPASPARMSPLDNYYQIMSMFYNFYSEAKGDIENMQSWLYSFLVESSGVATLACQYTTSIDANTVIDAYEFASNELEKNDGDHSAADSAQYSYIKGKALTVDRVYENFNNIHQRVFLTTKAYGSTEYTFPSSYMTWSDITIMQNRYTMLKSAGVTTASTFGDYLLAFGLITEDMKDAYVITEKPVQSNIPMDNSVILHTYSKDRGTKYFTVGDSIAIGSNGKRKAKYYAIAIQLKGETHSLDGNDTQKLLVAYANYYEIFALVPDEYAHLFYRIPHSLMVFRLD